MALANDAPQNSDNQLLAPSKPSKAPQGKTTDNSKTPETLTGKQPFIDAKTAVEAYHESEFWYWRYFNPLDEFERLARNKPSADIDPELPHITDGTLAAIVQEDPKRLIQQVPDGLVGCKRKAELAKIADYVLRNELIPMYNRMGNMLQKSWSMTSKAKTYGVATSYTYFTSTAGKWHTDFTIPYVKDTLGEKGQVFLPDCNIRFMRTWWQRRDVQRIINREKALMEANKGYKSEWDLKLLAQFLEAGASQKPANLMTPAEKEKGGDTGGYEVIHAFQVGTGAEFYSFSPQFEEGKTFRTKINRDPRGKLPLDDMYCNIDLSNPLGRGDVELSGGVQNLIDQQMQMYQFLSTLMMGPPLKVWGPVNLNRLKMRPNAIWKMGANPSQSNVEPYEVHTHAIDGFPQIYGLLKSQILNLQANQDTSISADDGNPSFSKTPAGVQAQQQRLGVSDNYLRKQYEKWFEDQSETSVNLYFAEMRGRHSIQLDADDRADFMKSPSSTMVDEKGILTFNYSDISKVSFEFEVDPSSSEIKEDQDNTEKLTEVLELMLKVQDPTVQAAVPKVIKLIINEIGAEGVDDIFPTEHDANGNPLPGAQDQPAQPPVTPQLVMQMVSQAVAQAMQQQQSQDISQHPLIKLMTALQIKFDSLPEDSKQQLLQAIGIPTQQTSPAQQQIDLKSQQQSTDTVLKADKQAHDTTLAVNQQAHNQSQDKLQALQQAAQPQLAAEDPGTAPEASEAPESPAQEAQESPQQQIQEVQQDTGGQPLDQQELAIAEHLIQRGFNDQDVEQAIVMLRQGEPAQQVIATLGAKYANQR